MLSDIEKRARQRKKRRAQILEKGLRPRVSVHLPTTLAEHRRMRECARKANLPLGLWLAQLALKEVQRNFVL